MHTETLFDFARSDRERVRASVRVAQPPHGAPGAGLVPYKTSLHETSFINTSPSAVAERRVKRLKRSVWASGHLHKLADKGSRPPVCHFVTLTYADAHGWRPDHISKAIQRFRRYCAAVNVPCRYTWVAEIQPKRAERTGDHVVHYHLLAWLPVGVSMPFWDRSRRRGVAPFWPHGWTNTEVARSGVGYLMKYLSKLGELSRFPAGLRLYGIGGLDEAGKRVRQWFNLPEWAKQGHGVGDLVRLAGRLVVRATGEVLSTPFRLLRVPGGFQMLAIRELPSRSFDGAYSTYQP
jgi:hypothetical protein